MGVLVARLVAGSSVLVTEGVQLLRVLLCGVTSSVDFSVVALGHLSWSGLWLHFLE